MRSTTRPTSRTRARITMPATWRWCARISPKFRSCWRPATPSVETEVNARKGRYQRVALPSRFGGQHMPHIEAIDLRREAAGARPLHLAAARRADPDRDRAARAGAVVPQSPRLCAADIMPGLRASFRLHDLRRLAGRSPLSPAPGLPPLRLLDAASAYLSALRGGRIAGRGRPRRRAPAGGGRRSCFRMRAPWCCRAI